MKASFPLISIETFKKVSSLLSGNYKTSFLGSGIEFADLREYTIGDSATDIDWRTTARTGKAHIKKYEEEREQKVLFLIDTSDSMRFWNEKKPKWETLMEVFSLLAFSSAENSDPIGAWFFGSAVYAQYPTKKGRDNLQRISNSLMEPGILSGTSSLPAVLHELFHNKIKNHLIFILTDSVELPDSHEFRSIADQNDCILVHIFDTFENTLEGEGVFALNKQWSVFIDPRNVKKKDRYVQERARELTEFRHAVLGFGGSYLALDESKSIYQEVYGFFKSRKNRGL